MMPPDSFGREEREAYITHRLSLAEEDLTSAKALLELGQYRGANNRAYYSIYHAISAVLSVEGVAFKRHKDTLAYFNKTYVSTEIFERTLGRQIVRAEEVRHASDYDPFYLVSKEVTIQQIETARQLLERVKEYVQNPVRKK